MKFLKEKTKKNMCKCGTPLPENYKYNKCTTCRRKNANAKKELLGSVAGLFGLVLAVFLRKKHVGGKNMNIDKIKKELIK